MGLRLHPDTAALTGVRVPDHVDLLADMACGAQAHMVFSAVAGGSGTLLCGVGTVFLVCQPGSAQQVGDAQGTATLLALLARARGCACWSTVGARGKPVALCGPTPQALRGSPAQSSGCMGRRGHFTWM